VPLEQWIYFLSTSEIPEDADAPGLQEAREKLKLSTMSREEQAAYHRYLDDRVILADQIYTARGEGKLEGRAEGREEGRAEGKNEAMRTIAAAMKQAGETMEKIAAYTHLSPDEIAEL